MSLGVLRSIDVDFSESSTYQYVTIFSDEIYSRTIEVNPLNNGAEYIIPQGTVARLEARKPDNKPIFLDCEIDYSANKIYVNLTPRCTDTPGVTDCQIGLYGVDNRFIASTHFFIDVYRSALSGNGSATGCGCGDTVECSGEYQSFRVALLSLDEVQKRATAAIDDINRNAGNANEATNRANAAADRANKVADDLATELEQARVFNDTASESERLRVENEALRNSSEELRQTNESARASSEEERAASEAIRVGNEYNRMSSETKRADAELLRSNAEKARDSAEDARIASEKSRASAETDRKASERERAAAELARDAEEITRVMNEDRRKDAEAERASSEASRKEGEAERETAENLRADAEAERADAEAERAAAEILRINAEEEREIAEELRIEAETERAAAEALRAEAESVREEGYRSFDGRIAENTARVSANHKRITNLERRLSDEMFLSDSEVAYQRSVPEDALPFAAITEIGGMSKKSMNLCPIIKTKRTVNGYVATPNADGSVTVTGTATMDGEIVIPFMSYSADGLYVDLKAGVKYSFSTTKTNNVSVGCKIDYTDEQGGSVYDWNNQDITRARRLILVYIQSPSSSVVGDTSLCGTYKIMINEGETALPYEPYFEGLRDAKVTAVESVGVNMISFPYNDKNATSLLGLTITHNDDQSITLNGTASGSGRYVFTQLNGAVLNGKYYCTANVETTLPKGCAIYSNIDENAHYWLGYTATSQVTSVENASINAISLWIAKDAVFNNMRIYPFLAKSDTALPYAPYVKHTFPIPEAVQTLEGYGQGVNAEYHNKIVLDPASGVKKFVKNTERIVLDGTENWTVASTQTGSQDIRYDLTLTGENAKNNEVISSHFSYNGANVKGIWVAPSTDKGILYCRIQWEFETVNDLKTYLAEKYAAGTPVTVEYVLAEPIETDIGEYVSDDNFLGVEGGGTITAANEYGFDAPLTVEYMLKEATV